MFNDLWVEKYRPPTLKDIVLKKEVREYFEQVKKTQHLPNHVMFCSPPGGGKTSLAKIIVKDILDASYLYINASDERGIDVIRSKVTNFAQTKSFDGKVKVVILDEMDGLTFDAQRALRNTMEEYADNVRFILTANYRNRIIAAIASRAAIFEIVPPLEDSIIYCLEVLKKENIKINGQKDKVLKIINECYPDIRKAINTLSKYVKDGAIEIKEEESNLGFSDKVLKILSEKDIDEVQLRKYVIENEVEFSNDYQLLLKNLFETVFNSTISFDKKREMMLVLGEGLYRHQLVMDFEINAFCTMIKLKKLLS